MTARLAVLVLLAGCARRPPATGPVNSFVVTADQPLGRHEGADICFPTVPPKGWRFAGARHYANDGGEDVSWGFTHDSGAFATVFVYPQHHPAPPGMSLAEAEARSVSGVVRGATWDAMSSLSLSTFPGSAVAIVGRQPLDLTVLVAEDQRAAVATALGLPSLDGVTAEMQTAVVIWTLDPWFLQFRITWPGTDRSLADLVSLLAGWSAAPCAPLRAVGAEIRAIPAGGLPPASQ